MPGRCRHRALQGHVVLFVAAFAVAVTGSLVPIEGSDIGPAKVGVSCGPALGAVTGWTAPTSRPPGDTIMLGTDYGVTASVWCTTEAARLLRPVYAGSAVLGLLSVLYVVALLLGGRRPAPLRPRTP